MRVTANDVVPLVGSDLDSTLVDALIADASVWVDDHLADKSLTEFALTSIEKYLAAHLVVIASEGMEGQLVQSQRDTVVDRFAAREKAVTPFLHTAAALDWTGTVRQYWIGGTSFYARAGRGYAAEQ